MKCGRCRGLMVVDHFVDMEETGGLWMCGWRCVSCGNVVDPEIMRRRAPPAGRLGRVVAAVRRLGRRRDRREIVRLSA
jgi:hypothetical protein